MRNLENGYLSGARCSVCEKIIVNKSNLINEESASETIFNKKNLMFSCENYSTSKEIPCSFCMCRQCYVDVSINDEKNDDTPMARRSKRKK